MPIVPIHDDHADQAQFLKVDHATADGFELTVGKRALDLDKGCSRLGGMEKGRDDGVGTAFDGGCCDCCGCCC